MLVLLALAVAWIVFACLYSRADALPSPIARCLPCALQVAAFALWVSRRDWESPIQPASLCELVAVLLTINVQAVVNVLHCARWRNMQRAPRPPQDGSAVVYRYKIAPSECDEHGRMYGGELLKLMCASTSPLDPLALPAADTFRPLLRSALSFWLSASSRSLATACSDVSAGLVAAKHAAGPCLTISADRVIFLEEVRVGDVISISSSVNRAWGRCVVTLLRRFASPPERLTPSGPPAHSSMEIGVRVMRQSRSDPLRGETYTCHAYLTFVAKPTQPPSPHPLLAVSDFLGLTSPPTPRRAQLPEVKPQTLLEQKRYLLAGRRRAHRIQRSKADAALHSSFRDEVFRIERAVLEADKARAQQSHNREDLLANLQVEVLTEAFMRGDPDVRTEGDDLVGEIEGFVEPVRVKRAVVEAAVRKKGHGGWHAIPLPEEDVVDQAAGHSIAALGDPKQRRALEVASHVDFGDTLSMVRPARVSPGPLLLSLALAQN